MAHIRSRLTRLEKKRRFLDWFVWDRILDGLTEDELRTLSDGKLPAPIPNRPSRFDTMDRKTLSKLWEENERMFAGRTHEEREYFTENCHWPELRGRFHFLMEDGESVVEWRSDPGGRAEGLAREPRKAR